MKKFQIITLAVLMAIGLGSCIRDDDGPKKDNKNARLTIKLSGVKKATRSIEAGAVTGQLAITGDQSLIFVADAGGTIFHRENIRPDEAIVSGPGANEGTGQELTEEVPLGSLVYIIANIPEDDYDAVAALSTLDAVKAAFSAISTQEGYTTPAMANATGTEVAVTTATAGEATVNISISPLIARLELAAIQAVDTPRGTPNDLGNVITGFDVTGVFVGKFYPSFTYTGTTEGVLFSGEDEITGAADAAALATVLTGWAAHMKDTTSVSADEDTLLAQPEDGEVWAYNLVASGIPHIVIRLENITYDNGGDADLTLTGARYLTVTGYANAGGDGAADGTLARGEVHRVGKVTGDDSNFKFGYGDLSLVPYEETYKLTVAVDVVDWAITDYTPIFQK